MCKKCKQLKDVWWRIQQLSYDLLSERNKTAHMIIQPERNSAWKALYHQRNKHAKV